MKKLISLLLVVVLLAAMFVVPVSADDEMFWAEGEYDVVADNNIDPHHAWGYVFTLDTINSMTGSTTALFTDAAAYAKVGKWSSKAVFAPTEEENVYVLVAAYKITSQTGQADIDTGIVDFSKGQIVLVAQDSGTRPEKNEDGSLRFPNWEERAAIWGLVHTPGAKVTLSGIDVAAGTMENGTVTVEADPNGAKVDYVIDAPETYRAGDEITVTVTAQNITAENGIHVVSFKLYYDNENLVLTNDLDEDDANAVLCVKTAPGDWENFTKVKNDYSDENEDGTEVKPLNDGVIDVNLFTAKSTASSAVKEDGKIVFEFTFKALDDAEDDLAFVIPSEEAECALNTDNGADVYAANGDCVITERFFTLEEKMLKKLGTASDDAKLDYVVDAPEYYVAGEEITVTVTVKNITAENGIHVAAFKLYYDNEKLLLTNDLDEEDDNALMCVKTMPSGWENFSTVANDYSDENEEGTEVKPLNDGEIYVQVFTTKTSKSAAAKEDGSIVFEFNFIALEDAKGDMGIVIPHKETEGGYNTAEGADVYAANGSFDTVHCGTVIKGSDSTCTETGLTEGIFCKECDMWIVEPQDVDALGHDEIAHDGKDATCTEDGYKAYVTCSRCDYTTYEVIEALGHSYKTTVTDPTCTEQGYTTYTCHCGDTYDADYVDALGHDEIAHNGKDATCTEDGYKAYVTCSRCDYTTFEEIEALGHDYKTTVTDPTCTEQGYTTYTCHCGHSYDADYVDALGHDYKTTVTDPTCTEQGYTTYTCHCGHSYDADYVDALGHSEEWVIVTEAGVGKEGFKELRCTVCGEVLDTEVIPALCIIGDANDSGTIDKYDYILVKRAVMGTFSLDDIQSKAADVNSDGKVDKYDYILIKRHVMGTYSIEGTK